MKVFHLVIQTVLNYIPVTNHFSDGLGDFIYRMFLRYRLLIIIIIMKKFKLNNQY